MGWPIERRLSLSLLGGIAILGLLILNLPAQAGKGTTERGWLGVYIQDLDEDLIEALNLKTTEGVLVNEVVEEGPAEEAGLKEKDVIVKYDDKKLENSGDLTTRVRATKPGEEVKVEINREGSKKKVNVVIGKLPKSYSYSYSEDWDFGPGLHSFYIRGGRGYLGVALEGLTEQLGDYFGVKAGEGALITEVQEDSPAAKAGLKAGDVIVKLDGEVIEDPGDVLEVIEDKDEGEEVKVEVLRDKKRKTFTVKVEERESGYSRALELSRLKLRAPHPLRLEPDILRIEIDKEKLEKELDKLKEELRDLKREVEKLKEKGI